LSVRETRVRSWATTAGVTQSPFVVVVVVVDPPTHAVEDARSLVYITIFIYRLYKVSYVCRSGSATAAASKRLEKKKQK